MRTNDRSRRGAIALALVACALGSLSVLVEDARDDRLTLVEGVLIGAFAAACGHAAVLVLAPRRLGRDRVRRDGDEIAGLVRLPASGPSREA